MEAEDTNVTDQAGVLSSRGNRELLAGHPSQAIKWYSQAIDSDCTRAGIFTNRSAAYFELQMWPESVQDADQALKLQPSCVKAYYRKALALEKLCIPGQALDAAEKGLGYAPSSKKLKRVYIKLAAHLRKEFQSSRVDDVSVAKESVSHILSARAAAEEAERKRMERLAEDVQNRRSHWDLKWDDEIQRMRFRGQNAADSSSHEFKTDESAKGDIVTESCSKYDATSPEDILGVESSAGPAEIRRAYLAKAIAAHPDKGGSVQEFVRLQSALKALMASCQQ